MNLLNSWQAVAPISTIEKNEIYTFDVNGHDILVYFVDDEYYAFPNMCTHRNVPLSDGFIQNGEIICRLHGAKFDLKTGQCLKPPARKDLQPYETSIQDNYLMIRQTEVQKPAAPPQTSRRRRSSRMRSSLSQMVST